MVMIGDVEIEVKLNYDNIDKALVELQEKLNKLNLQVPASTVSGKNAFESETTMGDGRFPSGAPGIGTGRKGYEYRASQVPLASGSNGVCCGITETKKTNALLSKQAIAFAKGLEKVGDSTKAGLLDATDSKFLDALGTALAVTDTGLNSINLGIALLDKVESKKNDRIWSIDRNLHNLRWNVNRAIPRASWDIVSAIERNSGSNMLDMIQSAISDPMEEEGGEKKIIDKKGTAKAFETVSQRVSKRVTRTLNRYEPLFDVFGQGDAYRRATSTVSSFIEQSGKTLSSPYMDPHFKELNENLGNVGQALASVAMGGSEKFDQSLIEQSKLTAKALDTLKNKLNETITEGKKQFSSEEKRTQIEEKITELENGIEEITKGLESGSVDLDLKSISEEYEKKIGEFLEEIEGEIGVFPIREEAALLYRDLKGLRKKINAQGIGLYDSIVSVATTIGKTGDSFQSTISRTRKDSLKDGKTLDKIKNSDAESIRTEGKKEAVLGLPGFGVLYGIPEKEQMESAQKMLGDPLRKAIDDENIPVDIFVPSKTERSAIGLGATNPADPGIKAVDYVRASLETDQANYSQDALDVIAKIYKTFKNNKELDTLTLAGHSLGGGITREVMEIIHELNLTELLETELGRKITIRGITIGTAVAGQADPEANRPEGQERDFFPLMSDADPVSKASALLASQKDIHIKGGASPQSKGLPGHGAEDYVEKEETRSAIGNFIKYGIIPEPEMDQQRPDLKEVLMTPIAGEVARSRELGGVNYIEDVAKRLNQALVNAGVYSNLETVAKGSVLASSLIARGVKEEIAVPIDEKAVKIQYKKLIEETAQKIFSGEISEDMGTLPELAFLKTNADRQKDWKPISDYLVNNAPEQILPEIMVLFGDLFDQQSEVVKKEIQRQVDVLRKTSANKIKNKEVATQKEQEKEAKNNPQPSEEVLNLVKDIPWDVPPPPKKLNAWDLLEKESTDTLRQVAERVNVSPYKDVEEKGIARLKLKTGPELLSDIKKAMASSKEPAKDIQRILNSMSLAEKEKNIASDIIGLKKSDLQALSASLGLPITRLFKDKEGKESKQSLNNAELAQQIIDNIQPIGKRKNIGGRERITKDPQFTYPEVEETMKRMEIGESTKSTADKLAKATVGELRIIAKALGIAVKKTVSDPENSEKISEVYLKQKELLEAISAKSDEEIEKARNTRRGEIGQEAETRGLSLKNVARQLNIKTEEEYSTKSGTPRIRRRKTGDVLDDISRKPKEEVIEAKRKAESFDVLPSSLEEKIMEDIDRKEEVIKQKLKELTENPKLFREEKKGEEDIRGALFAFLRAFKGKNPTGTDDPVESENEKFFSSIRELQKENNTSRLFQERVLKFEEEMQKQLHLMKAVIDEEFGSGTYEEAVLASAEEWSSKELKGFVNIIQDEFALKDDIEKEMIAKINSLPLTKKKKEKAIQQMKEDLERKLPKEEILANIQDTLRERGVVDRGEDPKGFKRIGKLRKVLKVEGYKGYSGKEIGTSPEMKELVRKTDEENEGKPDRRKNLLKVEEFEEIGRLVREGIQKGLTDQEIRENIFTTLLNKWQTELEIKSPSRVMIRMGQMIIKGLEIGLQSFEKVKKYLIDSTKEVLKTMERLININPVKDFQARGVELTRTTPISKSETVSEDETPENIREKPEDLFTKVSKNIYNVVDQVTEPIRNIAKTYDDISNGRNVSTSTIDVEKEGEKTGESIKEGVEIGLKKPIKESLMSDLLDKWKKIWGIHSPADEGIDLGAMIIKGLEIGLKGFDKVKKGIIDNTRDLVEKTKANVKKVTNSPVAEEIKERSGYNAGKQKVNETVESVKTSFNKAQKEAEEVFGIYEEIKTSVKEGVDVFNKAMGESEELFGIYENVKTSVKEGVDVFNTAKTSVKEGVDVFNTAKTSVKEGVDVFNTAKTSVKEGVDVFNTAKTSVKEGVDVFNTAKTSVKEGVDVFNTVKTSVKEGVDVFNTAKTSVKEGVDVFNAAKKSIKNVAEVIDKVADAAADGVKAFNEVAGKVKAGVGGAYNEGKKKVQEGLAFAKGAKETVVGGVKVGAEFIQDKANKGKSSGLLKDIINKIESEEVIKDAKEVIQDVIAFLRDPKKENREKAQETLRKKGYLAQKGNPEQDASILQNWAFRGGFIVTATKWIMDHKEEVQKFVTESIDTASRFERFTRSIDYIAGGAREGASKLSDLRETAKESGIELEGLIDSYEQLAIITKNTSLEGLTTDKLVKGLSQLGTQQGLSAEELQGAQIAIGQMAGKGVISAEEIRGQLAERLPGALQIASRSMGMSDKAFMALVATGKLSSAEFLPRFANQIEKETSARGSESSLTTLALLNKQKNAVLEIKLATGNLFLPIYKSWIKVSTAVLEGLKNITAFFVDFYALQLLYFGQTANAFMVLIPGLLPFVKILGTVIKHIFPALKAVGATVFSYLGRAMIGGAKQVFIFKLALESILATIDSLILVANGLMDWFGNGILKAFGKDAFVIDNTIWKDWGDTVVANSKRVTKALEEVEGKQKRLSNIQTPNAENKVIRSGNIAYDNFGLRDNALPIAGGFLAGGGIATAGFMAAGGTTALAGAAAGAAAGGFGTGAAIGSMAGPIGILVGALIGAAIAATAANMLGGGLNNSIRKDVEKENKKRAKKGLAEMTDEEINAYAEKEQRKHNRANMRKKDQAAIIRDIRVQSVHDTILDPAIKEIEKYKNGTGLFQQAEDSNKRLKALKEKESALDPNDKIGRDRLAEEIRKEEIYNRETTKPLDFMGESIRAALDSDRKRLKDYEQALIDQNLEGGATDQETKENKKKKERAEKFLRTPGNQFDDMEKVKVQIALLEKISNLFGLAEVESGAVSDLKKFTNALVELGTAFGSIEERMNAINRASLKGISLAQDKGFNNDRFNEPMTALRTAEEARKNTLRHLEEREKIVKRLEGDLEKGSGGEAKDRLIEAEEKNKGRKLTGEEIRAIATTQAAANPSSAVVQSLEAEAQLRDEKEKTLDLEKQAVDDIYNVKMAQQGLFLAQLEDFRAEGQAKNQRTLANATRRMNVGLKDGLKTDLGAEDKFNIGQGELQLKDIQNQIKLNEEAQAKIAEAYKIGKLSLADYTTQSRDLLTEDAQLKQQLAEQEVDNMRRVSQARINELQRIKDERDNLTQIDITKGDTGITRSSMSQWKTNNTLSLTEPLERANKAKEDSKVLLDNTNLDLQELEQRKAGMLLEEYIQRKRQLLLEQAQNEKALVDAEMARIKAVEEFRMGMINKMKEIREANTQIATSNRNAGITRESMSQWGANQYLSLEEPLKRAESSLIENQSALRNTQSELKDLEKAYGDGALSIERYVNEKRRLLTEQAQKEQSLADAEMARLKAVEEFRMGMLNKLKESRDANTQIATSNRNAGITRESMSQWGTNQNLSLEEPVKRAESSLIENQSALKNTKLELEGLEKAYIDGALSVERYVNEKRRLLTEQAQKEQSLADAEIARLKAVEDFRLALLDKRREIKSDNLSIKGANSKESLANIQKRGKIDPVILDTLKSGMTEQEAQDQLRITSETISALEEEYKKGGISLEKYTDRMRKLQVEQAQNRATLAESDLSLLEAQENQRIDILMKSLDRQSTLADARGKVAIEKLNTQKALIEAQIKELEGIKGIGDSISPVMEKITNPEVMLSYLGKQAEMQKEIDEAKIEALKIQIELNKQNLEIERRQAEFALKKQEIEARQAVLTARNGILAAQKTGDKRMIDIAQQQVGLANETLSAVAEQVSLSNELYNEKEKQLGIESASLLKQEMLAQRASKYEQAQKKINSLAQTFNNILDKQKEKIERGGAYKTQVFDARLAGKQGDAGLLDKAIDFQTQLNNPESDLLPSVQKEMEKQRKSALGGLNISSGSSLEDLYKKRLSMEDSIAKQKMIALEAQQSMDQTIFQMEMDRLKIEMTTAYLMAALAANQTKDTPVGKEAQVATGEAAASLAGFNDKQQIMKDTLAVKQAMERYQLDQEIYNSKNEERMKMAQGGFNVPGEVGKAPMLVLPQNLPDPNKVDTSYVRPEIEKTLAEQTDSNLTGGPAEKSLGNIEKTVQSILDDLLGKSQPEAGPTQGNSTDQSTNKNHAYAIVPSNTDNSVNIQNLTVVSSDPTGDARKVITDLNKAKNR